MKKVLLYLWQLPQNLLGLFFILILNAHKSDGYYLTKHNLELSLGNYIILKENFTNRILKHKKGHQTQSLILGPLYLIIIGIPSLIDYIIDKYFHKGWSYVKRYLWYYKHPWQKWADNLGGVKRYCD